jgi:hypothetical protein
MTMNQADAELFGLTNGGTIPAGGGRREIEYHATYGGYSNLPPVPGWEGKTYWARTSTLAKTLDDTYNLSEWGKRMVVWGLKQNPGLLELIGNRITDPGGKAGKEILNAVQKRAMEEADSHKGADAGTALHDLAEVLDATGSIPDGASVAQIRTLMAYQSGLKVEGLSVVQGFTERVVVCPMLGVAGRIDRILEDVSGAWMIGDLKSQKWEPGQYDSLALSIQLACYANASHMLDEESWTWERMPQVSTKKGVILWIPSVRPGVFEAYDVDLESGLKFAKAAAQLRKWRYLNGIVTKR